jgi:hypothetical protein
MQIRLNFLGTIFCAILFRLDKNPVGAFLLAGGLNFAWFNLCTGLQKRRMLILNLIKE